MKDSSIGILMAVVVAVTLLVGLIVAPEAGVDVTPTDDDADNVPSTGVGGMEPAELVAFCKDDDTEVKFNFIPAVGYSYELLREKATDGVTITELVTISTDEAYRPFPGKHWFNTSVGDDSEPATADDDAVDCLRDKGKFIP